MEPGKSPDDLHTILSRFHTWAEQQPGRSNGKNRHGVDGVRELTYEEAMTQFRARQAPRDHRSKTAAGTAPVPQSGFPVTETAGAATLAEDSTEALRPVSPERRETVDRMEAIAQVTAPARKSTGRAGAPAPKAARKPRAPARASQQPEFRTVLAQSVRNPERKPATGKTPKSKKRSAPKRTRRITTRFSSAEERQLEQTAAAAGMTVSAYLRKCALAAEQPESAPAASQPPATRRKNTNGEAPVESVLFSQPATSSFVGGWLTLLRRRFLASPQRFAERA